MSTLLPFVLSAMTFLAPERDHTSLAEAIASEVEATDPLFAHDEDRMRTAALVVAVAFRESTFRNDVVGDHGHAVCAMQIYDGPKALLDDPAACVRTGIERLRQSARIDREYPVAFYARGPRFKSDGARRISRDRMALAARVMSAAKQAVASL